MTREPDSQPALWRRRRARPLLIGVALVASLTILVLAVGSSNDSEVDRLADLLQVREGMKVAEIGAGSGWLTVEIATRVGASGRVFSTELSERRLDQIRDAVADAGLSNVTVVQAGERSANLPAGCCDAVFMRRVYHHLTDASAILLDLRDALAGGGRLVIIEFEAGGLLGMVSREGIDQAPLIAEVTASGFDLVSVGEWPGWGHYVAVFQKP